MKTKQRGVKKVLAADSRRAVKDAQPAARQPRRSTSQNMGRRLQEKVTVDGRRNDGCLYFRIAEDLAARLKWQDGRLLRLNLTHNHVKLEPAREADDVRTVTLARRKGARALTIGFGGVREGLIAPRRTAELTHEVEGQALMIAFDGKITHAKKAKHAN